MGDIYDQRRAAENAYFAAKRWERHLENRLEPDPPKPKETSYSGDSSFFLPLLVGIGAVQIGKYFVRRVERWPVELAADRVLAALQTQDAASMQTLLGAELQKVAGPASILDRMRGRATGPLQLIRRKARVNGEVATVTVTVVCIADGQSHIVTRAWAFERIDAHWLLQSLPEPLLP
jgi:hypothetical protein